MKKFFPIVLIIILIGIQSVTAQGWFNSNWLYRKLVIIDNSSNSNNLTNYQVNVVLDGASNFDFEKALADGADLRVTDNDGTTLLPFWIETWNPPNASIWVRVSTIPANEETKEIYLYFGNSGASSASDGDNTFVFFDSFEDFDPNGMNASNFLITPTYDGSGQTVHPDIVYIPEGWGHNNYKYWMVITPFRDGDDFYENPSILASNDGLTWVEPQLGMNPLVPPPPNGYYSDPDMILVNDELVLYFRISNEATSTTSLLRMTSVDGVDWEGPQTLLTFDFGDCTSPAVIYENGTWYMWYISGEADSPCNPIIGNWNVYMRSSSDGVNWSTEQSVNIDLPGYFIWHLDVQKEGSKYIMIFPAFKNTLGCLDKGMSLFYAESTDRINWTINPRPMLRPSLGWDDWQIYRSTFLVNGNYFRIWYSSRNPSDQWHTGYTEGELDDFFNQCLWEETVGEAFASTEQPRSGNYGLKENGSLVNGYESPQIFKNLNNSKYSINAWLYDDLTMVTNFFASLGFWYLDQNAGVGVATGNSTMYYVYYGFGYENFTATPIVRSLGWHKLSINMKDTQIDLLIDDEIVGSLTGFINVSQISLEGYENGIGWFDDVYVREYSDPDPGVSVMPADEPLPVELVSFVAQAGNSEVLLEWETASEVNNLGFIILRSLERAGHYQEISSYVYNEALKVAGNSNTVKLYSYIDKTVQNEITYWYKLVDVDYFGVRNEHPVVSATPSSDLNSIISDFELFQNYPNPFNSATNIVFSIPDRMESNKIKLEIFNVNGEKIKTLLDKKLEPGLYSIAWDGTNQNNQVVSSGTYFISIRSSYFSKMKIANFIK